MSLYRWQVISAAIQYQGIRLIRDQFVAAIPKKKPIDLAVLRPEEIFDVGKSLVIGHNQTSAKDLHVFNLPKFLRIYVGVSHSRNAYRTERSTF